MVLYGSRWMYLQVLNEVIEYTQALRVLAVGDVDEGSNLRGLRQQNQYTSHRRTSSCCVPQKQRARSRREPRVPACRQRSSSASSCRPLYIPISINHPLRVINNAAYLVISLDSTILLSSFTTSGPTHTARVHMSLHLHGKYTWEYALSFRMSESLR